jgi:hypothetical protein
MMEDRQPQESDNLVTVTVAMAFQKRGGRKLLIAPHNQYFSKIHAQQRRDDAMIKALARAYRWKKLLDTGEFATSEDLAATEKINPSYLARVLRLTLLAPKIVEAILNGQQPNTLMLHSILQPFPMSWDEQNTKFAV